MSGATLPVARPIGRALIIGSSACRPESLAILQQLGYHCAEADDPYAGMTELCRRPLTYRAVVLSLASLYREELTLIQTLKHRFPHLEVWLTHIDGRQAALADALRLGADGLLAEDGPHRTATTAPPTADRPHPSLPAPGTPTPRVPGPPAASVPPSSAAPQRTAVPDSALGDPILTAEELRALLEEEPSVPNGEEQ